MNKLINYKKSILVLFFIGLKLFAASSTPFGISPSQQDAQASLNVIEESDHYHIKAVRGPFEFWELKVDKQNGGIYSFKFLNSENTQDLLGFDGYARKVSLLQFKGRGGTVFSRRDPIANQTVTFNTAADLSFFEITYSETPDSSYGFFHNTYGTSLSPGELLTNITLRITPPSEQGTNWSWQKVYSNVSNHDISSKVWAQDYIQLAVTDSFEATSSSNTSAQEGDWDETNPTSYMRWNINSYSDTIFNNPNTITLDLTSGIFQNPAAGRSVQTLSWAGFDFLQWQTGTDYTSHLSAGATKTVEGSVIINSLDEPAKLEVTEHQDDQYFEIKAVKGSQTYWIAKVDQLSGGIFYLEDTINGLSFLGNEGYYRNVSLVSFRGRSGFIFQRRNQVNESQVTFDIANDGSYFKIIYDETQNPGTTYFHNAYGSTLSPGDLLTKISLTLMAPNEHGTTWSWDKEYLNVSNHAISNKVWAQDSCYLSLYSDSTVQRLDNTERINGNWNTTSPTSYMSYRVDSFLGNPIEPTKNFTFDIIDGIQSNHNIGNTVINEPWAGFYRLKWNTDFNYSGSLAAGEVRSYHGEIYFDIIEGLSVQDDTPTSSPHYEENTQDLENNMVSLTPVNPLDWSETHVRKVLHTFALGSQVPDTKIQEWASLLPRESVRRMLSFNVFNPNYSSNVIMPPNPYQFGELSGLSETWATELDIAGQTQEKKYGRDGYVAPTYVWHRAMLDPYVNPVRQRIGYFETSNHLSISLKSEANARQIFKYYDDIMNAHAEGQSYENILAIGARSAAIATQYNHKDNIYEAGTFFGNEDFAREFHQLFFGILGTDDPDHHEQINIRNTAKLLTDMKVQIEFVENNSFYDDILVFGTTQHHQGDLDILGTQISGSNASEKISHLASIAINHPESLDNLPIKVIESLSDSKLSDQAKTLLRQAWAANPEKNLLAFLRRYATSELFHSTERFKFYTTMERHTILQQRMHTDPNDIKLPQLADAYTLMNLNNAAFHPFHDVFGPMTGHESVSNSDHFITAWDNSAKHTHKFLKITNNNQSRDWTRVLEPEPNGEYSVDYVAKWLWQRFVADGLKYFGPQERVQIYALLAEGHDYQFSYDSNAPYASYDKTTLDNDTLHLAHQELLKNSTLDLESEDSYLKNIANQRIGLAISFIAMTPYMFAQEGL